MEKLNLFFSKIRELTFWQRVFSWRSVRNLSYDAFEEFKSLQKDNTTKCKDYDELEKRFAKTFTKNEGLKNNIVQFERSVTEKNNDINLLNNKITDLNKSVLKHETAEEQRRKDYENRVTKLNQVMETSEKEIKRLSDERVQEQQASFEKMKRQWNDHETTVQQALKMICQNHFIKYIDKVPFRGNPDERDKWAEEMNAES